MKHGFRPKLASRWQQHLPSRKRDEEPLEWKWRVMGFSNGAKPPMRVKHSELKVYDERSVFRRYCPCCNEGLLMVYRHQKYVEYIMAVDRCTLCAQTFIYDIVDLRESTGYPMVWESVAGLPENEMILIPESDVRRVRKQIEAHVRLQSHTM